MNYNNLAQSTNFIAGSDKFENIPFFLTMVNIPGMSIQHSQIGGRGGAQINVQGNTMTFNPLSIEMLIDEDFKIYKEVMSIIRKNINLDDGTFNDFYFDFFIEVNNNKGNKVLKLEFRNCRIESISDVLLNTQDDGTEYTMTIDLVYDYYEIEKVNPYTLLPKISIETPPEEEEPTETPPEEEEPTETPPEEEEPTETPPEEEEESFAPIQITASDAGFLAYFGYSVAVDGARLVVGASAESTAADMAGKVYIYDWNGTDYDEVGTLTASDAEANDIFGASVALDGTRLVVGAYSEDTVGIDAGKVYIYEWNGTSYVEVTTVTASDAQDSDMFGSSVALDGTKLAIGAVGKEATGSMSGKVYIYNWNGTDYDEVTTVTASDGQEQDQFGTSVTLDGTRLVVGAPGKDSAADDAGKVYVYDWNGSSYIEVGTVTASDAEAGDVFGSSVAVAGTRLVVGASAEDTAELDAGKVYIYEWNGTTYDEVSTLTASDAQWSDRFGMSVSLDGTRLVVGAPLESATEIYAGKVYIYYFDGTIYNPIDPLPEEPDPNDPQPEPDPIDPQPEVELFELQQITASNAETFDHFGQSVAVDGTRLVVGAYEEDDAATNAGKVYVYDWNDTTSTYVEVATVTASDAEFNDYFGYSVALSGTRLIVGAHQESTAATRGGKVYVYDWNGSSYVEVGTLTASDAKDYDWFGVSVALDGTRLAVGSYDSDSVYPQAGKVYIYDWDGTAYVEVATLTASDEAAGDWFGSAVALDGTRLAVGAANEDTAGEDAGKVYIYDWNGTSYIEVATLTASDAEVDDGFGSSVALDGTRLIVGAADEDTAGDNAGKVYIYDWNGNTYDEVGAITASDAQKQDQFGSAVALSGTRLAVGALREDTAGRDAGKAYIYNLDITTYDPTNQ